MLAALVIITALYVAVTEIAKERFYRPSTGTRRQPPTRPRAPR
jgi:hypothetical protein